MYQKKGTVLPIGSIDVSQPAEFIGSNNTPDSKNIAITRSVIRKRPGTKLMGTSLGEQVMCLKELLVDATRYLLRIGLTKVELYAEGSDAWSDVTGSALTGTSAYPVSAAMPLLSGARILVFSNYKDNIRKYTGTGNTADLGGAPPKAKFVIEYGAYLVLAFINNGGTKYSMRVQWCDTGLIETWSGGNSGTKDLIEDGEDITGLANYGDYLTVHKESNIYMGYPVTSSEVFRFERKNTGVGTICNNTIQNLVTGEQIFLAKDGIRVFTGTSASLIESPINDELREGMNPAYLDRCWSVIVPEEDEYWVGIAMGSETTPSTVYKFNYKTRQCYKDTRSAVCAAGKFQSTSEKRWNDITTSWDSNIDAWDSISLLAQHKTIIFGDTSGNVTKKDTSLNNDNGVAVSAYFSTKDFTADTPGQMARWVGMEVWAKGNTVKVEYSIDDGVTWTTATTLTLSSVYPADSAPLYVYHDVVATRIRYRFTNETAGETFYLKQAIINYRQREPRK